MRIPMISMRSIKQVARQIAREFHPQQITLFGSYAYGSPDRNSDVDLLVLMRGRGGRRLHDHAIEIRNMVDFGFPVDLLVRSADEFSRRIKWGDFFLREIRE